MKKAIYTVLLNDYDHIPNPPQNNPGWEKILFIDRKVHAPVRNRWHRVIQVEPSDRPDLFSRDIKWLSHKYLPDMDLVCYFDANMEITGRLSDKPFRVMHPVRETVRQEADRINEIGHLCPKKKVEEQLRQYSEDGFPDDVGLFQNGFFARYHSKEENRISEMVYDHVVRYTYRDQLSYPYAIWKTGHMPERILPIEYFRKNVIYRGHKRSRMILNGGINVHHITPARSDKNYGRAINDLIRPMPEQDWICLRDIDTIPLDHVSFIRQCEEIAQDGKYGLVSCMTNRLGLKHQLVYDKIQDEGKIVIDEEIGHARHRAEKYLSQVTETKKDIAGVMMLFPKRVWQDVGGFKEGGIIFGGKMLDNIFYNSVKRKGYKIGIARGIYLFHIYRWGENTRISYNHLK